MATSDIVQGKWNPIQEEEEEDQDQEEEEALSLSDLPINLNDQPRHQEQGSAVNQATQEEFNFRSCGAPFSKQPEMCVADEVFFKGQILPLRVSFSSEAGLLATLSQSQPHYVPLRTKPRIRNQFHMHPSPKPQLRAPTPTQLSSLGNPGRKSTSAWGIFRLGVLVGKGGGLLSGCDCSFQTVQPNNMVMIKGGNGGGKSSNKTESTGHAAKEKVVELKKQRQKQGKKVTSRRRTRCNQKFLLSREKSKACEYRWLGGEGEIGLGDCTKSREAEKRRNQGWESRERKR
ncbi:hypothetical protein DEO72_LG2g1839 [Vigna unguiculata]|uniref:Uncharacterized protein n=1 Tax=Vigna unguiculata TaxID=3917 RepID=A0A4D6KX98_VIGUN|nr:hypothetical protein DEO72_LG2g1839 [Vigna unguiculata]